MLKFILLWLVAELVIAMTGHFFFVVVTQTGYFIGTVVRWLFRVRRSHDGIALRGYRATSWFMTPFLHVLAFGLVWSIVISPSGMVSRASFLVAGILLVGWSLGAITQVVANGQLSIPTRRGPVPIMNVRSAATMHRANAWIDPLASTQGDSQARRQLTVFQGNA